MTDDFDVSLRRRLEGLAAAVPAGEQGAMTSVAGARVRPGGTGQRLAHAGLGPVVAILAIGALVAGTLGIGPFAPGASDGPSAGPSTPSGPVSATTRSGDFELTLRSAKARYSLNERIDVEASLTYAGEELGGVQIAHAMGADDGPMGFGIEEPVLGELRLTPTTQDACARTMLEHGEPLTTEFEKSGGFSGDDPRAAEYRAFFEDPELRLPEGTWHVYAVASFSIGDCSPDTIDLRVDLAIEVTHEIATPGPNPTGAVDPDRPVASTVIVGDVQLTIEAAKGHFRTNEPIDVRASLLYRGEAESLSIAYGALGPVGFTIPGVILEPSPPEVCEELVLERDVPLIQRMSTVGGTPEMFRLPHGIHEITAEASFMVGGCQAGVTELMTQVLIAVAEDENDVPIRTVHHQGGACALRNNSGSIVAHAETGLGVRYADGQVRGAVWPFGYSARRDSDGVPVLIDAGGQPVARESDPISFGGGVIGGDGPIYPCDVDGPLPRATPTPSPSPRPEDVQVATSENATFRLELRSTRSLYTGEPISVTASYVYIGPEPSIVVSHFEPEVGFAVEQLGVESTVGWIKLVDSACSELRLQRGVPRDVQLVGSNLMSLRAASLPEGLSLRPEPIARDAISLLPPGDWEITATLTYAMGSCAERGRARGLTASIEIAVGSPAPSS